MKKCCVLMIAVLCVAVCGVSAFAAWSKQEQANVARLEAFMRKMETLTKSVQNLADSIAAYNKPIFEAQLTKQERRYSEMGEDRTKISPILWNRV